jgi:N,N'-diacetyllegionaminate synthase
MVKAIRNIEISLGSEIKAPSISESKNIRAARKSIVAKTHIRSGDILHENNLTTKRSGGGISAMHWDDVIGTISNYEYDPDDEIKSNQ